MNLKIKGSSPFQNLMNALYFLKKKIVKKSPVVLHYLEEFEIEVVVRWDLIRNKKLIVSKTKDKIKKVMDKVQVEYHGLPFKKLFKRIVKDFIIIDKPTSFAYDRYNIKLRFYRYIDCNIYKFKNILDVLVYKSFKKSFKVLMGKKLFLVYKVLKDKSFFNIFSKKKKTIEKLSINQYIIDLELEMKDRKLGIMFNRFFKYAVNNAIIESFSGNGFDLVIKVIQKNVTYGRVFTILKEILSKLSKNVYIFWYIPLTYFKKKLKKIKSIKKRLKKRLVYSDKMFLKKRFIRSL